MSVLEQNNLDQLLSRARSDAAALNELCREVEVRLRPILEYRLRGWPKQDKEDLLQNTLITFCEKLDTIRDNPAAVALMILRNKIGNELQSVRRVREVPLMDDYTEEAARTGTAGRAQVSRTIESDDNIDTQLERRERSEIIARAIQQLAEFCRIVLTGLLQGYAVMEIWERMKDREPMLTRGAFDKRIFDCKKKLKSILEGAME